MPDSGFAWNADSQLLVTDWAALPSQISVSGSERTYVQTLAPTCAGWLLGLCGVMRAVTARVGHAPPPPPPFGLSPGPPSMNVCPDGRLCRAIPLRDRPYCFWHDPDSEEKAAEARRLGGLRRRRGKALAGAPSQSGRRRTAPTGRRSAGRDGRRTSRAESRRAARPRRPPDRPFNGTIEAGRASLGVTIRAAKGLSSFSQTERGGFEKLPAVLHVSAHPRIVLGAVDD